MIRRTLFWQFFGVHVLLLIAAVGFVASYMWQSGRTTYRRQWLRELEVQARLAAALLPDGDVVEVGAAAEHFFERLDSRRASLYAYFAGWAGDRRYRDQGGPYGVAQ